MTSQTSRSLVPSAISTMGLGHQASQGAVDRASAQAGTYRLASPQNRSLSLGFTRVDADTIEVSDACPKLIWEIGQQRHKEFSAQVAMNKNASEDLVDKDNHAWVRGVLTMGLQRNDVTGLKDMWIYDNHCPLDREI